MFPEEVALTEFITAFDAKPDWNALILEEAKEVNEVTAHLLKELSDFAYVVTGAKVSGTMDEKRLVADPQVMVALKWAAEFGAMIPAEISDAAFNRVHASNMSKLGPDGKPIRREDGKILKGPNYAPPDLDEVVARI